jgi:uncharacterized protein YdaU (DUF1376 family)
MPLYVADYLRDTRKLTAAEHGAYLLLIMEYWTAGTLPDDDRQLARIASMSAAEWKRARPNIEGFFHDGWKHKRLDAELARSAEISSKRAASAKQKHNKSSANAEQLDTHARASSQSQPQHTPSLRSGGTRASALAAPWSEADWDQFWQRYPNKIGKADARKAFEKATKKIAPDVFFNALQRYATKTDDRPFCNPATWLNQERWLDQPAANPNGRRTVQQAADDLLAKLRAFDEPAPSDLCDGESEDAVRLLPPN